jgi:hypothetical protein
MAAEATMTNCIEFADPIVARQRYDVEQWAAVSGTAGRVAKCQTKFVISDDLAARLHPSDRG